MVEALYGSDWRIPNPDFKYDAIDWGPFQGFTVRTNLKHWEGYYSNKASNDVWVEVPSQFAAFCVSEVIPACRVLDFGSGNGRDSIFFSQLGHNVLACDYSKAAIELVNDKANGLSLDLKAEVLNVYETANVEKFKIKHPNEFDLIYSRFTMHAITPEGQNRFLRMAKTVLKEGGKILLEFRNSNDPRKEFGTVLSDSERSDGHYRRFINTGEFLNNVTEVGLIVDYVAEGTGFAKLKDEDPNITRIILSK